MTPELSLVLEKVAGTSMTGVQISNLANVVIGASGLAMYTDQNPQLAEILASIGNRFITQSQLISPDLHLMPEHIREQASRGEGVRLDDSGVRGGPRYGRDRRIE